MLLNSCRYFLLFFLFEANLAIAQTNAPVLPKKYYERVDFAYAHYRTGDYKVSARAFEEAFAAFDGKGRPEDRYNAARAWAMAGNADSAFFELNRIVQRANYSNYDRITTEAALTALHSDIRWELLLTAIKANKAYNLGFEKITDPSKFPFGWFQWGTRDYTIRLDSLVKHNGKYSASIEPNKDSALAFGCVAHRFPVNFEAKEIEVRAWLKSENAAKPIGLLLRMDGYSRKKSLALDNMMQRGIKGTNDWARYSVKLSLPKEATNIYIGAILSGGKGKLWIDDVELLVDDKNINDMVFTRFKDNVGLKFNDLDNLPEALVFHTSVSDGNFVYALNGQMAGKTGFSGKAYRRDTISSRWLVLTDLLEPKAQAISEYVPSTRKIFIMGGVTMIDYVTFFDKVETVDVRTGKVQKLKVKNPWPSIYAGSAVWEDKVYVFGGTSDKGEASNKLYAFDTRTNTFDSLPPMPEANQAAGEIVDGVLYTFGGYNSQTKTPSDAIYAYNIAERSWKLLGRLPIPVSANAVTQYGPLILIAGSFNRTDFFGYYDTRTQEFKRLATDMTGRRHAGIGIIGDELYLYGGNTPSGMLTSTQSADLSNIK